MKEPGIGVVDGVAKARRKIAASFPEWLFERVRAHAIRNGLSMSAQIVRMVASGLQAENDQVEAVMPPRREPLVRLPFEAAETVGDDLDA
jgi:hypothetical protein